MARVQVNRRIGYWQNKNTCDQCGALATTARLHRHGQCIEICRRCLTEAIAAIDAAVLADAGQDRVSG